jgi:hypothetical protein
MQPLYEDKWTTKLNSLENDFDIGPTWAYRDIFNKSIEKLKDVSTMNLCYTTLLIFLI